MSLAKCILSQNVRRVRVCMRLPLPARNLKAPGRFDSYFSWRMFVFHGSVVVAVRVVVGAGVHFAGLLWSLKPISQMTPQSSRAMETLILL
jgi:hypothetical protein